MGKAKRLSRRQDTYSRKKRKTSSQTDHEGVISPVLGADVVEVAGCSTDLAGSGGCAARTLCTLGLLGRTPEAVVEKLDASIEPVLAHFNSNRPLQDHDRRRVGVEGQEWHYDVIRHAMKADGSQRYLKKQLVHRGGCVDLHGDGEFFVDGHLNRSYVRFMPGGLGGDRLYHAGHDDPQYTSDGTWRHCVAVKNGRVFCNGLPEGGVPGVLWLDENGSPDNKRGYMNRILKVYKVMTR